MFRFRLIAAAMLLAALPAAPAGAINIILVYDDLGENPDYDLDGTRLMAIASAAETIWERLIPSAGTHEVDVSWSELEENQIGLWKFDLTGANNLYFDADSTDWFFDETPLGNGEFDFGDPLAFDSDRGSNLAGEDPSSIFFDGTDPPAVLEIARFGLATSSDAEDNHDLLSVVLHEMGHELGVAGDFLSGRYPLDPDHVLGIEGIEVIEGDCEGDDEGFCDEHGHVAPPDALMSPGLPAGVRTLPSAMDVLVAARDSNYEQVDLARKFAGRSGSWGDATDWIGGRVPDDDDDAYLVHGGTTTVTGSRSADSVFIDGETTLDATGDLTVDHELVIGNSGELRSAFGSQITAEELELRSFGHVELTGGHLVLGGGFVASGGTLSGRGIVETNGTLRVSGLVEAEGDLRFDGAGELWLLAIVDDDETGILRARDGNLGFAAGIASNSAGRIEVSGGHNLTALADLTIPNNVQVQLHDDDQGTATINSIGAGVDVTIGNLFVGELTQAPADGQILARTVRLENRAEVHGDLTLSSSVLTTLAGGLDISGYLGHVIQDGDISVQGGIVDVSVDNFDWGNSTASETNSLTIDPGATLRIRSPLLGSTSGIYRGDIQIDSGLLDVWTDGGWTLPAGSVGGAPAGNLAMIHSGAGDPIVRGEELTASGSVIVSGGDAFIEAPFTTTPTSDIFVWGNSALFLDGPTTIGGGSWGGLGTLVQSDDITVTEDTTIATEEFHWGNSFGAEYHSLTVQGSTLTVDSAGTGDPDNDFRGTVALNGGELVVNTDLPWTLPASSLFFPGGALEMNFSGGAPRISGQALTIGGSVFVTGGDAHIDSDLSLLSTSETDIAVGATLHTLGSTGYRGTFTGGGTLHHEGSALYTSSAPLEIPNLVQDGRFTFFSLGDEAVLDGDTVRFADGSETRLISDLRIKSAASVEQGADFTSSGMLIIDAEGSLSGATVAANVRNEGTLSPGFSPGLMEIEGDLQQLGNLQIELGGTLAGVTHDVLAVDGDFALDGTLELILYGGFAPVMGDSFDILDWTGAIGGAFSAFVFPGGPTAWDLTDLYTTGVLRFVPEPGTALLLAFGLAALRRRRV